MKSRHTEICIIAAHTFVERGYDATSVNDIAAAIGITKAGLYHYISSKESLLFDIVTLGFDALDEKVVALTRDIKDPEERLRAIVLRHAALAIRVDGVITRLSEEEVHALPPAQRRKINQRRRRYFDYVRDTLIELQKDGRLHDIDVTVAAFSILGIIMTLPQWYRPDGRLTDEEVAAEVLRFVAAGLLRPRPHRKRSASIAQRPPLVMPEQRRLARRAFPQLNPRRFEICMTSARRFVERGFEATSVNDIASALGVTKAGLYHYISSKEALFFEILSLGMDWLDEDVIKPVRRIEDPEARLRETIKRHALLTACNEPWITELLGEMQALRRPDRETILVRKRTYVGMVRHMFNELAAAGRLRDLDHTVAVYSALGMIVWIPRWLNPKGRLSRDQVAADVATFALNALLKPDAKTRGTAMVAADFSAVL